MIEYHKNNVSAEGKFIVSHSHLCLLDPMMGGHPTKFYKAFMAGEKEPSATFDNGNLLHHWMQHKDNYVISDTEKPGPQVAALIEHIFNYYFKEQWKLDPVFEQMATKDTTIGIEESVKYKTMFALLGKEFTQEEFAKFVAIVRYSRKAVEYNKSLKEITLVEHIEKALPYLNHLRKNDGKVILTSREADILYNSINSLSQHPYAAKLVFDLKGESEKEYYWAVPRLVDYELQRKAKLDKIIIDEINRKVTIIDLKTTSYPVSDFTKENSAYNRYKLGRQLVSYLEAFLFTVKEPAAWKTELYNVVVQTNDEYPVMVYRTSNYAAYSFRNELLNLEERAAWHISLNQWNLTKEEASKKGEEYITI